MEALRPRYGASLPARDAPPWSRPSRSVFVLRPLCRPRPVCRPRSSGSTPRGRWPSAVLAVAGSLTTLVEAASLAFLFTFSVVCGLAFLEQAGARPVTGLGALLGTAATVALIVRLVRTDLLAIGVLGALVVLAVFVRPVILRHVRTESSD